MGDLGGREAGVPAGGEAGGGGEGVAGGDRAARGPVGGEAAATGDGGRGVGIVRVEQVEVEEERLVEDAEQRLGAAADAAPVLPRAAVEEEVEAGAEAALAVEPARPLAHHRARRHCRRPVPRCAQAGGERRHLAGMPRWPGGRPLKRHTGCDVR